MAGHGHADVNRARQHQSGRTQLDPGLAIDARETGEDIANSAEPEPGARVVDRERARNGRAPSRRRARFEKRATERGRGEDGSETAAGIQ